MAKKKETVEEKMEKMKKLEQELRRIQSDKRRLKKEIGNEERKKRDHALIVVGAHLLTHYDEQTNLYVLSANDEQIKAWVDSLFSQVDDND